MKRSSSFALLVLPAIAMGLSLHAWDNPFILDDLGKIVENTDIRRLGEIHRTLIYPYEPNQLLERNDPSRPLVFLVYAAIHHFVGASPLAFHAVSGVFHALATMLVFVLTRRALGSLGIASRRPAFVTASLFAVAPIQMGTVVYAYGMSDVLSAMLVLACLYAHTRAPSPRVGTISIAALAFALALAAKQSAIVALPAIVLYDWVFRVDLRSRALAPRLVAYAALAFVAVAYLAFRVLHFGAIGDLEGRGNTHPAIAYALSQPLTILRYVALSFVPRGLSIDHYVTPTSDPRWLQLAAAGLLAALIVALVFFGLRSRSKSAKLVLFGGGFYLLSLAPTSSILPTVDVMVERRVYMANWGLFLMAATGVEALAANLDRLRAPRLLMPITVSALLLALAAASLARNTVFRTNRHAWEDVLRVYPDSPRALNNLANVLMAENEPEAARAIYERLIRTRPRDYTARGNLGAYYNHPETPWYDPDEAARLFEEAIRIQPHYISGHYNLARLRQIEGRLDEAEARYRRTLELAKNHVDAHNNLGLLHYHRGEDDEARRHFAIAMKLDPSYAPAQENMALLARSPVPLDEVPSETLVGVYEDALARDPGNLVVRRKFAELCAARKLPCEKPQLEILRRAQPDDPELRAWLEAAPD